MRWLLPWLSVLCVSSAIAYAAERGFERVLHDIPPQAELALPTTDTPAGYVWVLVETRSNDGVYSSFDCLAPVSMVTTDIIEVHAANLNALVGELCTEVRRN